MPIEARRHNPRVKLEETAYINFGSGNRGVVRDISDGGLGFSSTIPIESGREIRFRLSSSDKSGDKSGGKYEAVADVAWNDSSRMRGGLRFKTVPPEIIAQLRTWMEGQSKDRRLSPGEKGDWKAIEADVAAEWTDSLEVTGLGPEVGRSRESDERVAAAAVEILAAEGTGNETAKCQIANTPEPMPSAQDEVDASTSSSFANFTRTAPGTQESELTMFPPEATPGGGYTFSSRAQRNRRNLLGVAVIILLCATGASAAALWYVYPSQSRYEMQRVQDRIARFIDLSNRPGYKQPTTNVEPASISGGLPDDEIANAVPESTAPAPDVTGTQHANVSGAESKTQDSPDSDAAATTDKSEPPIRNQSDTELALARTYLENDSTPDQKTKAVQLLWLATERGNVDAELQLADLYASGENVPKSCVQARILLKAAQVANPSAAEPKLKELDQAGCS